MSIGKRICELRKAHAYSQEYVAERLGVSRQAVSKWETDASAPDTYNLIALAELFEVSVEFIAIGKRPEQAQESERKMSREARQEGITPQRIVGFILLGVGLLALILGILLSEFFVLILSIYLLVGSVLCLAVRKRMGVVAAWTYSTLTFVGFSVLSTQNPLFVFNPASYRYGFTLWHCFSFVFWGWLAVTAVIACRRFLQKRKSRE